MRHKNKDTQVIKTRTSQAHTHTKTRAIVTICLLLFLAFVRAAILLLWRCHYLLLTMVHTNGVIVVVVADGFCNLTAFGAANRRRSQPTTTLTTSSYTLGRPHALFIAVQRSLWTLDRVSCVAKRETVPQCETAVKTKINTKRHRHRYQHQRTQSEGAK